MTIDATWGGSNANAYDTVDNVNAFINSYVFDHSDWELLTLQQKEAAIHEATRDIDSVQFIGCRYYEDQALEMPRAITFESQYDRAGPSGETLWSETHRRMQRDVQQAVAYQALYIARNGGRNCHAENQAQGIKAYSEGVGPVREQYVYGGTGAQKLSQEAASKLAPWRQSKKVYRG